MTETGSQEKNGGAETIVGLHVCLLLVAVTWAFGGNADWVRVPIALFGTLGPALSIILLARRTTRADVPAGVAAWALPVLLLNALVACSCLTPGLKPLGAAGVEVLMPVYRSAFRPSAAQAAVSLRSLWIFDALYFSCLNIALFVRGRRTIRLILAVAVVNALALSVFGTVQKLTGAEGLYFGRFPSPQVHFFASFVYDNHWGAFVLLVMGACIGLTLRYAFGRRGEGLLRGPAALGMLSGALICLSVPLSGARACTLLLCVLVAVAAARGLPALSRSLEMSGLSRAGARAALACAALACLGAAWYVAGDVIQGRAAKTREQLADAWSQRGLGSRSVLYADTLRMARDRPLFGWGMGSYPLVFHLYNTQRPHGDLIPVVYHDAHSDWLQSLAEIGAVGTALIGAAVILPALALRRARLTPVPFYLLAGCGLVGAYAWVEFPFGNLAVVYSWWLCYLCAVTYARLGAPGAQDPT